MAEIAARQGAHVVLVTSMLVTPKNRWNPIRLLLNNIRYGLMDSKFKGGWVGGPTPNALRAYAVHSIG